MSQEDQIQRLLERIDARLDGVEKRLERSEALEDIRRLIVDYARAADQGNNRELLAPLFADDMVWEAKGFGSWKGKEKSLAFLEAIAGEKVWWSLHFMISPKIDLAPDCRSASLIWYLWEPATMPDEETRVAEPHWITGLYESEVIRTDEGWKFTRISSGMNMISPAKKGWVEMRFPKGSETMPYLMFLEQGRYAWCACGKSAKQPFCDGSHKGTGIDPVLFRVEEADLVGLCGCKKTGTGPFCDGSHMGLEI